MNESNPFQSPVVVAEQVQTESVPEILPFNIGKSIFKWLLICSVNGGPPFFYWESQSFFLPHSLSMSFAA